MATGAPVEAGLFTEGDEPQLVGSRCRDCRVMTFPRQADCPHCNGEAMEEALFDRRGTLWTFTIQNFIPKSPPYAVVETEETFVPYGVGYVEFEGQARVEGRLTENDPSKLRIGMPMETVLIAFGDGLVTYAFEPVAADEGVA
jgi:uncharacterized OB-fold protein